MSRVARLFVVLLLGASTTGIACSADEVDDASEASLELVLSPNRLTPPKWIEVRVEGLPPDRIARSTTTLLQARTKSGQWEDLYVLVSRSLAEDRGRAVIPAERQRGATLDQLHPTTLDLVRIPDLPPGSYRLKKELALEEPGEDALERNIFAMLSCAKDCHAR